MFIIYLITESGELFLFSGNFPVDLINPGGVQFCIKEELHRIQGAADISTPVTAVIPRDFACAVSFVSNGL